jgi:peptidoglycan/LPS O-acetylase OafA/YrhL
MLPSSTSRGLVSADSFLAEAHPSGAEPSTAASSEPFRFPSRIDALDALRGFAALLIFVFHYFALFPFARGALFEPMAGAVLNYFGMGVPLFFALSGLSLCLGFFEMRSSPLFLRQFFVRRFLRIAPLFYFATLVWVLIFGSRGVPPDPIQLISTVTFVFNLLPGLHESAVAAGWSIGVEMLFYASFPCVVTFVTGLRSALAFFAASSLVSVVSNRFLSRELPKSTYSGLSAAVHLHYFAAGIVAYFVVRAWASHASTRRHRRAAAGGMLALFVVASIWFLTSGSLVGGLLDGALIRTAWALPICGILVLGTLASPMTIVRPFARLGEWSYSVYLLHPICLYFLFEYLKSNPSIDLNASTRFGTYFIVGLVGLLGLSALTFRFIESPFLRLGRRWSQSAARGEAFPMGGSGNRPSGSGRSKPLDGG